MEIERRVRGYVGVTERKSTLNTKNRSSAVATQACRVFRSAAENSQSWIRG